MISLTVYTLTLFLSAFLLFSVQPMVGKMILPLLGGTPNVWNTCMVFFQTVLLLGYCYAHSLKNLKPRFQFALHLSILILTLFFLPPVIPENWVPPAESNPSIWLFKLLAITVGLPFFIVSTTAPLLQKWFSGTNHPDAKDPYFLYAASNSGSLLALLSYPFLIEPAFELYRQSQLWSGGYVLFLLFTVGCILLFLFPKKPGSSIHFDDLIAAESRKNDTITSSRRLTWIILAFIPSSLMLGVTTYITTDVASVPLIWIIPLSLYLLSFILVFAKKALLPRSLMNRALAFLIIPVAMTLISDAPFSFSYLLIFTFHILAFFCIAMICHGRLADDRPSVRHLTEFYLWISVGGVLGGIFNALAAPGLFNDVYEYPLILVFACFFRPSIGLPNDKKTNALPLLFPPVFISVSILVLYYLTGMAGSHTAVNSQAGAVFLLKKLAYFGIPAFLCFVFRNHSKKFGLCIAAFLLCNFFLARYYQGNQKLVYIDRGFFGVNQVWDDSKFMRYTHGTTVHGIQSLDPRKKGESLSYFHRTGPVGQILATAAKNTGKQNIAVLGLGAGSLASYGTPFQTWDFYEIDPIVKEIAVNPDYFTFIEDSPAEINILLGDGRLKIQEAEDRQYDLIILDAFSSDSIPTHLVTREALDLYLSKLAEGGFLVFNISNRFLNMKPILSSLAAGKNMVCYTQDDLNITRELQEEGKSASAWAILARKDRDIETIVQDPGWKKMAFYSKNTEWTDHYSNILSAVKAFQSSSQLY